MNLKANSVFSYGNFAERHSNSLFIAIIGLTHVCISRAFSLLMVPLARDVSVFMETAYSFPAIRICWNILRSAVVSSSVRLLLNCDSKI